jgi:inorganic triphosphatase YgiF
MIGLSIKIHQESEVRRMASEIEIKLTLPDKFSVERIIGDEFFTRYIKDEFTVRETLSEYYDTPDWALAENDYFLRIRELNGRHVAVLKQGRIDAAESPGLFTGQQWLCFFDGAETVLERLIDRAAPPALVEIVGGQPLAPCFHADYTRRYTALYMPDMVRIELSFDIGELRAEGKSEPLYEMGLELLYGGTASLLNFSAQLREYFDLPPTLLTKQQRALRLLRSR